MPIITTFKKPEYWYVIKDISHNKWEIFEKWFREKGRIRDDYNGHWEYFTHDQDGYNILPNKPKNVQGITVDQWKMWYSSDVEQEKIQTLGIDIGEEGGDPSVEVKGTRNSDGTTTITSCEEIWNPTPGEMIEVSGDGDNWEKEPRKFIEGGEKSIWYWCQYDEYFERWLYVRPNSIKDKKKLLDISPIESEIKNKIEELRNNKDKHLSKIDRAYQEGKIRGFEICLLRLEALRRFPIN